MSQEKNFDNQLNFSVNNKKVFYGITIQKTVAISEALADLVRSGDTILLFGEIGSGKTFISRKMIQRMMQKQCEELEDVPSPTFTIVQIYDKIVPQVWHLDLYRISNSEEIVDLDLESALETNVLLIEWPQNMGSYIPERNLSITLEETVGSYEVRNITLEFNGYGWEHIINGLIEGSFIS